MATAKPKLNVATAVDLYVPIQRAASALAEGLPLALPAGWDVVAQIERSMGAADIAAHRSPLVQDALAADVHAMDASVANPQFFGLLARSRATGALILAIRGTKTHSEWLHNFKAIPSRLSILPGAGEVHLGFERLYGSIRESLHQALSSRNHTWPVTVLGHSLGGALATLAATDICCTLGLNAVCCTFGSPMPGKSGFQRFFNRTVPQYHRISNQFDIVPHLPSVFLGFRHPGVEVSVDGDVDNQHGLSAYLTGLRRLGESREVVSLAGVPRLQRQRTSAVYTLA